VFFFIWTRLISHASLVSWLQFFFLFVWFLSLCCLNPPTIRKNNPLLHLLSLHVLVKLSTRKILAVQVRQLKLEICQKKRTMINDSITRKTHSQELFIRLQSTRRLLVKIPRFIIVVVVLFPISLLLVLMLLLLLLLLILFPQLLLLFVLLIFIVPAVAVIVPNVYAVIIVIFQLRNHGKRTKGELSHVT